MSKNRIIIAIAALFVIILGIQAYMTYRLNDRLNQLSGSYSQAIDLQSKAPSPLKPTIPIPSPDKDLFQGIPWNPYEEMQRIQNEMEHLFGDSFSRFHINAPFRQFKQITRRGFTGKTRPLCCDGQCTRC
jgi:hypothetical protein